VFLALTVIGLVGLVMLALPALGGHHPAATHAPTGPAHAPGPLGVHGHTHTAPDATAAKGSLIVPAHGGWRFVPSPRAVFSLCALYGASGNALVHAGHLTVPLAALIAVLPAVLAERLLVRPVWGLLFRFQGAPSSPLEQLILTEARAVIPFRNGRGMVAIVRDGRQVQLPARLREEDAQAAVRFGQRLRIEDVDPRQERVTVSIVAADEDPKSAT
jgi:hypothetical protein